MHRLQAQTLPDATPPIDKINPFSKIAVTDGILMPFGILKDLDLDLLKLFLLINFTSEIYATIALCEKPLKKWNLEFASPSGDYLTFLCLSLLFLIVNNS